MATDAVSDLLTKLNLESDGAEIKIALEQILQNLTADGQSCNNYAQTLVDGGILVSIQQLLSTSTEQACTAQVLAELAKHESLRQRCVDQGLIPPLLDLLASPDMGVCTQACRSLGNICYDNDNARNAVDAADGTKKLIDVLRSQLDSEAEGASRLRMTACGFLLNLTNTHECIQEKAVMYGAVDILDKYLSRHCDDESVTQMALMSIGSLADSEFGKENMCDKHICESIVKLLSVPIAATLQDAIFDQLSILAEIDEMKLQLAKTDLKHHLINLIRSNEGQTDVDSQNTVKIAADLIILMVTGDESMEVLFEDAKGIIYQECLKWMTSTNEHLRMSGALAMGNFARNDAHCLRLVKEQLTSKLLNLLQMNAEADSGATLQHAVFSALRNLAIPGANKSIMLKSGILDKVLPFAQSDVSPVQFKLLGLLRMLVDGQESAAKSLGTNTGFISRLVEFCGEVDHAGVKGEATRLLSWLIKHSRSSQVMKCIVGGGGTSFLVTMATSEHAVMQNEALMALTLISSSIPDQAADSLVDHNLSSTLHKLMTDGSTLAEILCNCLTLVTAMHKTDTLKKTLVDAGIRQVLDELSNHSETMVTEQVKKVTSMFDKG